MEHVKLSILMPAFNASDYIGETIGSLLQQSFTEFELLIGDDGSSDQTKEIIDSFEDRRIKCFHNEKNEGKQETCRKLFAQARGKYVTVHDADDISHHLRFQKQVALLEQHPEIGICGVALQLMANDGYLLNSIFDKKTEHEEIERSMLEGKNEIGNATVVIRKELVEKAGGLFRPFFENCMDLDLSFRIMQFAKAANINEVLYYYRHVPNSISKAIFRPKQRANSSLALHFYRERLATGTDTLAQGDEAVLEELVERYCKPYTENPARLFEETAGALLSMNLDKEALRKAWHGVKLYPGIQSFRTFFYVLRKVALKSFDKAERQLHVSAVLKS